MFLVKLNKNLSKKKRKSLSALDENLLKMSPKHIQELILAKKG